MVDLINRRRMLGLVGGMFGMTAGADRAQAAGISPRATCSWQLVDSICGGGTTWELWRLSCCDVTGCHDVRDEWRPTGSC